MGKEKVGGGGGGAGAPGGGGGVAGMARMDAPPPDVLGVRVGEAEPGGAWRGCGEGHKLLTFANRFIFIFGESFGERFFERSERTA